MLFVPLGVLLAIKTLKVELYFVRKAYKLTMHLERFSWYNCVSVPSLHLEYSCTNHRLLTVRSLNPMESTEVDSVEDPRIQNYCLSPTLKPMASRSTINYRQCTPLCLLFLEV